MFYLFCAILSIQSVAVIRAAHSVYRVFDCVRVDIVVFYTYTRDFVGTGTPLLDMTLFALNHLNK